jgi:hypothetical protein
MSRSSRFLISDVAVMHAVGGTVMAGDTNLEPERNLFRRLLLSSATADGALPRFGIHKWHISENQSNLRI